MLFFVVLIEAFLFFHVSTAEWTVQYLIVVGV